MTYPGIIFWLLLIWGTFSSGPVLLYLLMASMAFGTLAVVPPAITGGTTILPTAVCAAVLVGKLLLNRSAVAWIVTATLRVRMLGLLALFIAVALIGAAFLPHLFAGIPVIPFRPAGAVVIPSPLHASGANFTQSAYLLLSVLTVFAFAYLQRRPGFQKHLCNAMLIGAAVTVATGLADIVAQNVGLQTLLDPFRNATYSLLTDADILGATRIVGLMPEASAYGPLCVSFAAILIVLRSFYETPIQRSLCTLLVLALLMMGWLSISSTAFLCLVTFGAVYVIDWWRRMASRSAAGRRGLSIEFAAGAMILLVFGMLVAFDQAIFKTDVALIKDLIFDKTGSSSYAVRSTWNHIAWQAMLDTWGVGIGVGATRASNGIIAVFSNTGIVGGVIFSFFVLQTFLRRPGANGAAAGLVTSFKLSLAVPLVADVLTATSPDFGVFVGVLIGSVIGLSLLNAKVPVRTGQAAYPASAPVSVSAPLPRASPFHS